MTDGRSLPDINVIFLTLFFYYFYNLSDYRIILRGPNIDDVLLIEYIVSVFLFFLFVWCPCMAISISAQYNGGLISDIILLTQCYFHHVVVFFTLTDRASTIPSNIRGCQSGTWSQRGTKVNRSHRGDRFCIFSY